MALRARSSAVVWFKTTDLRLRDHEPLFEAHRRAACVTHLFVFNPAEFGAGPYGFPKCGHYRSRFLLEAVHDLRANLKARGSNLILRTGDPAVILPAVVAATRATAVFAHAEITSEEAGEERAVAAALSRCSPAPVPLHRFWGNTLYHLSDLPFRATLPGGPLATLPPLAATSAPATAAALAEAEARVLGGLVRGGASEGDVHTAGTKGTASSGGGRAGAGAGGADPFPATFTGFRKRAEGGCRVREPLPIPAPLKPQPACPGTGPACGSADPAPFPLSRGLRACGANAGEGAYPSLHALGAADLAPHFAALHAPYPPTLPVGATSPPVASGAGGSAGEGSAGSSDGDDSFWGGAAAAAAEDGHSPCAAAAARPAGSHSDEELVAALATLPPQDPRGVLPFRGGETAGLARVQHYGWGSGQLSTYKETRNGMLGEGYSTKLSPWLAFGCVSARTIAAEVRAYEAGSPGGANESTYWLLFELLWRDFFKVGALAWGASLFKLGGPAAKRATSTAAAPSAVSYAPSTAPAAAVWRRDPALLRAWCTGNTGYPFVDAAMRELLATGFQSNRSRQNVASFLAKDLGLDWRAGAEWFESLLIDHDPCANYGNWTYVAGVGCDPREDRYFLIPKQSRMYDADGNYMRHWLPELAARGAPTDCLHDPWRMRPEHRGTVYPSPVVQLLAHRQSRGGGSAASYGPAERADAAAGAGRDADSSGRAVAVSGGKHAKGCRGAAHSGGGSIKLVSGVASSGLPTHVAAPGVKGNAGRGAPYSACAAAALSPSRVAAAAGTVTCGDSVALKPAQAVCGGGSEMRGSPLWSGRAGGKSRRVQHLT